MTPTYETRPAHYHPPEHLVSRATLVGRCVRCGCEDRVSRAVLERASARPLAIRRIRLLRVAGIPLIPARRARLLTPAIGCTNAQCKCDSNPPDPYGMDPEPACRTQLCTYHMRLAASCA